jgi:hypothetical protein
MKTTLMTIALAAASLPMFAAQATPANPPAAGTTATKPAVKATKKHKKAATKKVKKNTTATPAPAAK